MIVQDEFFPRREYNPNILFRTNPAYVRVRDLFKAKSDDSLTIQKFLYYARSHQYSK